MITKDELLNNIAKVVNEELSKYFGNNKPDCATNSAVEDAIDEYVLQLADFAMNRIEQMSGFSFQKFNADYEETSRNYCFTRYGEVSMRMVESLKPSDTVHKADDVAEEVKRIFKLDDFQVVVEDPYNLEIPNIMMVAGPSDYNTISLIISNNSHNFELVNRYMEKQGYRLIRKFTPYYEDGTTFHVIVYTPVKRIDITGELAEMTDHLYHVSPSTNRKSLERSGIIPRERTGRLEDGGIIYPPRVYMFTNFDNAEELKDELEQQQYPETFDIYEVALTDISKSTEIYYDPLYGKNSVYVEKNIPASIMHRIEQQ